jgi:molybdopterin/thiamine biosynthesis adenylyltransferase
MDGYKRWLTGIYPDIWQAFAVLGTHGIDTAVYTPDADQFTDLPTTVIGNWTLDPPLETPGQTSMHHDVDRIRYDRSIRALGESGQQALAETHIGLVGAGGLGSIMAEEFARYGVQKLTLVDPDIVERSNLPRLFGCYDHQINLPKVAALTVHLRRVHPGMTVVPVRELAEDAEAELKQCDLIVAGVDQVSTRMWLNQFAVRHLIPYVDAGVIITVDTPDTNTDEDDDGSARDQRIESMEGYIQYIAPGATACFDCLDRGDPEQARIERPSEEDRKEELDSGYIDDTDLAPEPAVVPLNGIIASKTVQLVAKHVTGYDEPAAFLRFEGLENELTELDARPSANCPTCGHNGILGRGDPTTVDTSDRIDDTSLDLDTAID